VLQLLLEQLLQPLLPVSDFPLLAALNSDSFRLILFPWHWVQGATLSASLKPLISSNSTWQSWHWYS